MPDDNKPSDHVIADEKPPASRPSSVPPSAKGFVARAMGVKELILALSGLAVAIASIFKPQDHSTTKAAYEELSKDVQEVSSATQKNHDDLTALRGYLDGLRGTTLVASTLVSATATMPSFPTHPPASAASLAKPPMPPFIGPRPTAVKPPTFDIVQSNQAKK